MADLLARLQGGLIVSCQAPADSPLHDPQVISAMAMAAERNGAVGVRIDTPAHVAAVKTRVQVPVIGLWKVVTPSSEVYITPRAREVLALKEAGTDLIALDCTGRPRPDGEVLAAVIAACHSPPFCPVLADVSTVEEGIRAVALGADAVATTLYGYTAATRHLTPPGWGLLEELLERLTVPVLVEGGIQAPLEVQRALASGAWAVVVGGALTGLDQRIRQFCPTDR
ncbi:N-acetylmannosamine-6-phosphate 2-epimerase [Anthocerotibacter panamensis]|uniref:N-acetylmannosamine-6-phosphate 2-epimerase n=1 Tax=Anthocerotibacter panamensis TaxID=2857077 RepID=UPI001C4071FB|nr:N-acetylmannosamine-6-phosphate 2-epimerase [Anthocerotibacter panamensis]